MIDLPRLTAGRVPARRGPAARLVAVAVVVLLLLAAMRAVTGWQGWSPFQERVVDTRRPALMLALSDLSEYRAARGSFQVVVDLERDTPYVPAAVKGERTTYLAVGSVDGVVDFRDLGADAVEVGEDGAVTITLPQPTVGAAALDLEHSRVLARDRGLVDRVAGAFSDRPTSERDVALLAEDRLEEAAAASDLVRRAEDSTRAMLVGLARSLGYSDVTVRFDAGAAA